MSFCPLSTTIYFLQKLPCLFYIYIIYIYKNIAEPRGEIRKAEQPTQYCTTQDWQEETHGFPQTNTSSRTSPRLGVHAVKAENWLWKDQEALERGHGGASSSNELCEWREEQFFPALAQGWLWNAVWWLRALPKIKPQRIAVCPGPAINVRRDKGRVERDQH